MSAALVARPRAIALPGGRSLSLAAGPLVMGIVNCTPDSFFPGSRASGLAAVEAALAMAESGADMIDLGGESTRPGSDYVSEDEELSRVLPVVEGIRRRSAIPLSIDTRKATVAEACLRAGADIVNDVSALEDDPAMAGACARAGACVVLMHKRGDPKTMQEAPSYASCSHEVFSYLLSRAGLAEAAGMRREAIVLDPGIGFGKRLDDNLELVARLPDLAAYGYAILVGLSRKSFVGAISGRAVEDRLPGSLAAGMAAALRGADILRVHDSSETVQALAVFRACLSGKQAVVGRG